jgi:hypothetical protein
MMPFRVQLKRTAGWRMPENTVKVDRSTTWGNPFVPGMDGDLGECLVKFEASIRGRDLSPLKGKNLACWCAPGAASSRP